MRAKWSTVLLTEHGKNSGSKRTGTADKRSAEELNYRELYRAYSPRGRKSKVDPRVLFKVMVYGYQRGIYSSRKLEETCRYRIDFMWLLENMPAPDHTMFSRFRIGRCTKAAKKMFYQCVKLLEAQQGPDGETVCIDGTKMESRAERYIVFSLGG